MRQDQEFIWGEVLKADLKKINEFYLKFPQSEKEKGIMHLAPRPPASNEFMVSQLWNRYLRPLDDQIGVDQIKGITEKEIVDSIVKFHDASSMNPDEVDFTSQNADAVSIQRFVKSQKGSWWQVPKGLKNSN